MKIYIDDNYDKLPTIEKMTTEYFFSCADLKYLNTFYITPVISIVSILLNMTCFLTFANSTLASYTRSNMFKFLKCKALVDSLELSTRLAKLAYNNKRFRYTLVSSVLRILVGDYLKSVLSMLCIVTEILADLNRLFEMRNSKSAWRRVKTFRKQITGLVSITCFVYVYGLFEKKITVFHNEFNATMYESKEGYFGNSDIFKYIKFTNGILRDIICVCVLIAIDCLILVEFRRVIQRKKRILSNCSSQSNGGSVASGGGGNGKPIACMHHSISRVELAEKRLTQMILVKSAVRVCGHMPYFLKYIPTMQLNMCFREISSICFITSDAVNIFIYYAYNRIFREYINSFFQMRSKRKGNQQTARNSAKPARNTFHTDSFLNSSIKHAKNRPVQL